MNTTVVKIFEDDKGHCPYLKWFKSIKDIKTRIRIQQRIRRIELGNFGVYRALKGDIFEIKLSFGAGYRVYYGHERKHTVVLLCGGDKSTQKTDIENARKYWIHFKERFYGKTD